MFFLERIVGSRVNGRNACTPGVFLSGENAVRDARKACNDQITFPVLIQGCYFVRGFVGICGFSG